MKTRTIITAAIILFSVVTATAGSKQQTITFRDSLGRTLSIPLVAETEEAVPFDIQAEFSRIRTIEVSRIFDISQMMKAEKEEELPFDLDKVFQSAK